MLVFTVRAVAMIRDARQVRLSLVNPVLVTALQHRDPFDRLLVAQAFLEPVRLLTTDATLLSYLSAPIDLLV